MFTFSDVQLNVCETCEERKLRKLKKQQEVTQERNLDMSYSNSYASAAVVAAPVDLAAKQREEAQCYISNQYNKEFNKAFNLLEIKFGLADQPLPKDAEETVARILAGQYVLDKTRTDDVLSDYYSPWDGLRWRDPATVVDKDGFKVAMAALELEQQKVKDAVKVLDPAVALDALNGFREYVAAL